MEAWRPGPPPPGLFLGRSSLSWSWSWDDTIKEGCALDAIITVVDCKHIMQHLDEVKPEGVVNEALQQVAFADKMLINKV